MVSDNNKFFYFIVAFAVIGVCLALIGGVRFYSPVPFQDMWDGSIGFYLKLGSSGQDLWWAQHNEHRIILPRFLTWLDFKFFDGLGWPLIAASYSLLGVALVIFRQFLRDAVDSARPERTELILLALLAVWVFLWAQRQNLTWAFQVSFVLAQVLPLAALFCLYKSQKEQGINALFVLACSLGFVSIGSLISGVMILPIMLLYALCTRQTLMRLVVLGLISVIALYLYFNNYSTPGNHGSIQTALTETPLDYAHYVLLYLGNPFYQLLGKGVHGQWIAMLASSFMIISSAYFFLRSTIKPEQRSNLQLALLAFILYVGGTAFATAGGRVLFGVEQSLSGRYLTPTLMAWAALGIIYAPMIVKGTSRPYTKRFMFACGLLMLLMTAIQLKALRNSSEEKAQKNLAALALELGVNDAAQIKPIYPLSSRIMSVAREASDQNLSIFGRYPLLNAREQVGQTLSKTPAAKSCEGEVVTPLHAVENTKWARIRGWMLNESTGRAAAFIRVLDSNNLTVGYAVGHFESSAAEAIVGEGTSSSGFHGYVLASASEQPIILYDESTACVLEVTR